ncbi:MAG: RNA polymerase sigma factor [Pyrinomonadaceae bacterium]
MLDIHESLDHLFRRYAGQMVSVLARQFGFRNLEMIEDAVQDALVAAMKKWPFTGQPENARAWLIATAKNRLIDQLRRVGKSEQIEDTFPASDNSDLYFAGEIEEDELRMIFACCHPAIPPDAQVALTLKTVGGFSVAEIARAFLSKPETIAKMLTRAKSKFRANVDEFNIPSQVELTARRDAVLKVLYLMFNEGYAASEGDELVRKDLCFEAIRLASIIAEHQLTKAPTVHALLALFLFQAARLETRVDQAGELLLLEDQDRSLWNKEMLASGLNHFRLSASGDELSDFHVEAEIAALHATAEDFASTDWPRILECYDELQRRRFSPVAELNRIVAIDKLSGSKIALEALEKLAATHRLGNYNLLFITKAHLLAQTSNHALARSELRTALSLTTNVTVRRFIEHRLESI